MCIIHNVVGQILRRDIDAFGTDQTEEGPPYCRVLIIASDDSMRTLSYKVAIHGVTSDVKNVLIHCTQDQALSES